MKNADIAILSSFQNTLPMINHKKASIEYLLCKSLALILN